MKIPAIEDAINGETPDVDEVEGMWLILFEEDYENLMYDAEDNVAVLFTSAEQAREVVRLGDEIADRLEEEA